MEREMDDKPHIENQNAAEKMEVDENTDKTNSISSMQAEESKTLLSLSNSQAQAVASLANDLGAFMKDVFPIPASTPTSLVPDAPTPSSSNGNTNQSTSSNNNQLTTAEAVKKEIEDWKQYNTYVKLNVLSINDNPDFNIQLTIGPYAVPLQLFANQNWKPMFLMSESSQLEEYLTPINHQIEEQSTTEHPMTITNLLNMFGLAYNEHFKPKPTITHSSFTNFPLRSSLDDGESPKEVVVPTSSDWDEVILPEVKKALEKENFQKYEVDEWLRRIQLQLQRKDTASALSVIQDDILGGAIPPEPIRKFFDTSRRFRFRFGQQLDTEKEKKYIDVGGTQEASERLQAELTQLKELNCKELGFTAEPKNNNLYHWHISLFGFGNTKLGQDLVEWSLKHNQIHDNMKEIEQDILLEMKFPPNYPNQPPHFRIIRPRFQNIEVELTMTNQSGTTTISSNTLDTLNGANTALSRKSLSVSRVLEKSKDSWIPSSSIADIIQQIRTFFLESGAHIDVDSSAEGYSLPTIGGFWKSLTCVSPATVNKSTELEGGGKIILPPSALEDLSQDMEKPSEHYFSGRHFGNLRDSHSNSPMIFELSTGKGKRSFCGVEEFTAEEGHVIVPEWILSNLECKEGASLEIRRVSLPRGVYVKLQPHTADFLEVNDTKAMLEWVLPKFVVMSVGDTIVIPYRNKKYPFNVLEVKPGRAIHIIDSDITTEFAPPLNGSSLPIWIPETSITTTTTTTSTTTSTSSTSSTLSATPTSIPISASPAKSTTTLSTTPGKGEASGRLSSGVEGVDFKLCDNCKQRIPINIYTTHSLSCSRMNWFCDSCQMVTKRTEKEKHMSEFHAMVYCECGTALENRVLQTHKEIECPKRIVRCQYCPLEMPYNEKLAHENRCGSQTEKCDKCNKYIRRSEFPVHIVECSKPKPTTPYSHFYRPIQTEQPDFPEIGTSTNKRQGEEVLLCPICMNPFVHLDDLEVHMISQHENDMDKEVNSTISNSNATSVQKDEAAQKDKEEELEEEIPLFRNKKDDMDIA